MLTFEAFTGINNVIPAHRLGKTDLLVASDVNIGRTGEITRRGGFTELSNQCHKNVWQANGFMLATWWRSPGRPFTRTATGTSSTRRLGTTGAWYSQPAGRLPAFR